MTEARKAVIKLEFSLPEAIYLYRLVKGQGYLSDEASATAYRKLEEGVFSVLSLEQILKIDGSPGEA